MKDQYAKGPDEAGENNFVQYFTYPMGYDMLPDDFDLIIIKSESTGEDWMAGYAYGLAVSKPRNEVIYFHVSWH